MQDVPATSKRKSRPEPAPDGSRAVVFGYQTRFEVDPLLVRAWLTPFRTPQYEERYDMPTFEVLEKTETAARARCAHAGVVEEHTFKLVAPLVWERDSVIFSSDGTAMAHVSAHEEILSAPDGCMHVIRKSITPLTRSFERSMRRELARRQRIERDAYRAHAEKLARRVRADDRAAEPFEATSSP